MARIIKCDRCDEVVSPDHLRIINFVFEMTASGTKTTSRELCNGCYEWLQRSVDNYQRMVAKVGP